MADAADVANDYIDTEVTRRLRGLQNLPRKKIGPETCKECGEQMLEARKNMGFELCVDCAEDAERRKALFAGY